jgi:hypothetical protein
VAPPRGRDAGPPAGRQSLELLDPVPAGSSWFFSFLAYFTSLEQNSNTELILLLDEPGLSLHAWDPGRPAAPVIRRRGCAARGPHR